MAFDGGAPSAIQHWRRDDTSQAFQPMIPVPSLPAVGEVAIQDRLALTLGYGAFGLCLGAVAALMVGTLELGVTAALVTAPTVAAVVICRSCVRVLHWSALPLIALIVGAAGWAIASATLPEQQAEILPAVGLFALVLPMTSIIWCRAFPAAFAVAMLGMALAAPVGAATMLSVFG